MTDDTDGVPFSAIACRTIEGEIKRHFRDRLAVRRANDVVTGLAAGQARRVGTIDPAPGDDDVTNDRRAAASEDETGIDGRPPLVCIVGS
jgi:hypothetical protein